LISFALFIWFFRFLIGWPVQTPKFVWTKGQGELRDKGRLSHRFIMAFGKAEFSDERNSFIGTIDGANDPANMYFVE
jgi:hypothetical protein